MSETPAHLGPWPPPPAVWGPRFNRAVAILLALIQLAWLINLLSHGFSLLAVLLAPLGWLYLYGVVAAIQWLILRRRGGARRPALVLVPRAWLGRSRLWLLLLGYVALFTAAREGAFAPGFVLNFDWYRTKHSASPASSVSEKTSHTGLMPTMRGKAVVCKIDCRPRGQLCSAYRYHLRCDEAPPKKNGLVEVQITAKLSEPFCYLPLFKGAMVNLDVRAEATTRDEKGTLTRQLSLNGPLRQVTTGLISCYRFRRLLGRHAAVQTAQALGKLLAR